MARFSPLEHIRRRADFEKAYEVGAKVSGRFMSLFVIPTAHEHARLGIAATRKMGSAVVRNRAKRLARELFRHQKPSAGLDIVVVPRREFLDAPYLSLEREFGSLMERAVRIASSPDARPRRSKRPRVDSRI